MVRCVTVTHCPLEKPPFLTRELRATQAEIQNDGGSLGLLTSLKTHFRLSHLIKRESLIISLRQYCLDFPIFTMIDSTFYFSPTFTSNLFFEPETKMTYV